MVRRRERALRLRLDSTQLYRVLLELQCVPRARVNFAISVSRE